MPKPQTLPAAELVQAEIDHVPETNPAVPEVGDFVQYWPPGEPDPVEATVTVVHSPFVLDLSWGDGTNAHDTEAAPDVHTAVMVVAEGRPDNGTGYWSTAG